MSDITIRLRTWLKAVDAVPAIDLMDEAANEIARLRGDAEVARLRLEAAQEEIARLREAILRLADQDATLSVSGGNVIVTMDATLTDEERGAVQRAIDALVGIEDFSPGAVSADASAAATLRGLLERMK